MPPKASQGYANVHAFQPNRGKKVKVREKSTLECAVGAALAGVCSRCCEQLKWCARARDSRTCCACVAAAAGVCVCVVWRHAGAREGCRAVGARCGGRGGWPARRGSGADAARARAVCAGSTSTANSGWRPRRGAGAAAHARSRRPPSFAAAAGLRRPCAALTRRHAQQRVSPDDREGGVPPPVPRRARCALTRRALAWPLRPRTHTHRFTRHACRRLRTRQEGVLQVQCRQHRAGGALRRGRGARR
jgi:hypothetical protein